MKKHLVIALLLQANLMFSQNIDIDILRRVNLHPHNQFVGFLQNVSNTAGPVAFGLPVVMFGLSFIKHDTLTRKHALVIGASVVSSIILTNIVKYSVNRTRPFESYPFIMKLSDGGSPSFPSGHTADAFSLATAVSLAYPKWYVIVPAYTWATAVGYSRMSLGVHYPSDVLMGAAIGAGSAFLCFKGQKWLQNKRKLKQSSTK